MRVRTVLLILALAVPCLAVAANQVYRWKDTNGVVQFSDSPPAEGIPYKIVNIKTGVTRDPPQTTDETASDGDMEDAPTEDEATTDSQARTMRDTPDNRQALCSQLAANIDVLEGEQIVMAENSDTPLTDEQRASQLAEARSQQAQYCADSTNE